MTKKPLEYQKCANCNWRLCWTDLRWAKAKLETKSMQMLWMLCDSSWYAEMIKPHFKRSNVLANEPVSTFRHVPRQVWNTFPIHEYIGLFVHNDEHARRRHKEAQLVLNEQLAIIVFCLDSPVANSQKPPIFMVVSPLQATTRGGHSSVSSVSVLVQRMISRTWTGRNTRPFCRLGADWTSRWG